MGLGVQRMGFRACYGPSDPPPRLPLACPSKSSQFPTCIAKETLVCWATCFVLGMGEVVNEMEAGFTYGIIGRSISGMVFSSLCIV